MNLKLSQIVAILIFGTLCFLGGRCGTTDDEAIRRLEEERRQRMALQDSIARLRSHFADSLFAAIVRTDQADSVAVERAVAVRELEDEVSTLATRLARYENLGRDSMAVLADSALRTQPKLFDQ